MNDEIIQKILNYTNEHLFEPGVNWPKSAIMERSYERWAVDEILLALMDHPMTEADLVIEGFILKMELFSLPVGRTNKQLHISSSREYGRDTSRSYFIITNFYISKGEAL